MLTVKVVDSTFSHNPAIGYAGERRGDKPRFFHWDTSPGDAELKVWTDIRLKEALDDTAIRKVALLIEPPSVNAGMYEWIAEHHYHFDAVLTHQKNLVETGHPFLFYPYGGSWIREWGMYPKDKMISMLVSPKGLTEAHRLRHQAAKLPNVDSYGNGVGRWVESKAEALREYRFAVIIENGQSDWYFSEKLVDAISQGCVPIYRGCPSIGRFFNLEGIIQWQELDELEAIVRSLTPDDYEWRRRWVEANIEQARLYQCPEDWIMRTYGSELWTPSS